MTLNYQGFRSQLEYSISTLNGVYVYDYPVDIAAAESLSDNCRSIYPTRV